jgi:hypothetical protein
MEIHGEIHASQAETGAYHQSPFATSPVPKRGPHGFSLIHRLRPTGITAYKRNGGRLELAQQLPNRESPRTTKLHDRTEDEIPLDEVERIAI